MGESLIFILVIKFGLLGKVAALASYGGGRCRRRKTRDGELVVTTAFI